MLKITNGLFFCLAMLLLLESCSSNQYPQRHAHFQQWMQQNGKVKVLSTTEMISDLVKQIGADHVDSLTLIQGELDPHSYQLVKGDDEKLAFAQLIFYNGLGLEHGPSLYHHLVHNPKAIALGDKIEQQHAELIINVGKQKDPHIWMDISIWMRAVPLIVDALSKQDPAHAADYIANGQKLEEQMKSAHQHVRDIMHQIPESQRYLVTSHDAFNYFARAYLAEEEEIQSGEWRKRFVAPEGLAPESQLSAINIKEIIHHLKRYHIHLLFPESNISRDSIRKIVQAGKEQGLDVKIACCALYGDAMGAPGSEGDSYLKMILYNAHTLSSQMHSHVPVQGR